MSEALHRALTEQSRCRDWLAEHRGEEGTEGAELGASDWVKEELLIAEDAANA
jgi:hypothetical protein